MSIGAVMFTGLVFAFVLSGCRNSGSASLEAVTTVSWETTAELRMGSSAMEPTLHCAKGEGVGCEGDAADKLLVRAPVRGIRRTEIVAFRTPTLAKRECEAGGVFIMRVVGLPGDVWELRNGFTHINGRKLQEDYVRPSSRDSQTLTLADLPPRDTFTRIPQARYLLMGDNRNSSCDSRRWGLVRRADLVGRLVQVVRATP